MAVAVSVVSFKAKRSFVASAVLGLWLGWLAWASPAAGAATPARTILVLGDSISAGYGINVEEGWVALLQKRLKAQGYGYRVVNASVSGETTSGGLQRLPRAWRSTSPRSSSSSWGATTACAACPSRPPART
jgi:acyl-CoA thioesterase I